MTQKPADGGTPSQHPPQIFMCALGDYLRMHSASGDPEATRMLASQAPADMPAAFRKQWRDREIRAIAAWLRGTTAAPATTDAIAKLLAKAGVAIGAGTKLRPSQFARFGREELAELEARLSRVIGLTRRPDGSSSWPSTRQLATVLQFSPVVIAEH